MHFNAVNVITLHGHTRCMYSKTANSKTKYSVVEKQHSILLHKCAP